MKKFTKGFTLIELLIVIALLGALAVALLAALDPLEQINKGTDTGVRNTVAEISGSLVRYASVKSGIMPYTGTLTFQAIGTVPVSGIGTSPGFTAVNNVIGTGELKQDFFALAGNQLDRIFITGNGTSTYVCFAPIAKSFKADNNTKFTTVGSNNGTMTEDATCLNGTNASGICYWCVR